MTATTTVSTPPRANPKLEANAFANSQHPMTTAEFTLDQAPIGRRVRVVGVTGDDGITRRLADLGVRCGIEIECLRRAPLGDPTVFELCGYQLCLRRTESARVRVVEGGRPSAPNRSAS